MQKFFSLVFGGVAGTLARYVLSGAAYRMFETNFPYGTLVVNSEEKINRFLPHLDEMVEEGLVTLEKANVVMYRAGRS